MNKQTEAADILANALDELLRVTLDAMRAEGIQLTNQEQRANDNARAALAAYRGNQ